MQVDKEIELPLFPPVHLLQESADMYGCGLALFEAGLVDLGRKKVRSLLFYLHQDRLLHDLGDV